MCLGVPGKVVRWLDRDPTFALAEVEFEGIRRQCHMACVDGVDVGEYVIVHAGIAICKIDTTEASRVLEELRRLDLIDDDVCENAGHQSPDPTQSDAGQP
jgi:hydrogenase expression/formation protein HypC